MGAVKVYPEKRMARGRVIVPSGHRNQRRVYMKMAADKEGAMGKEVATADSW
jgi:hypothetical protein